MNNKSTQPVFNIELGGNLKTHQKAWNASAQELIPEDLAEIISQLHKQFNQKRLDLLTQRNVRQIQYDAGESPDKIVLKNFLVLNQILLLSTIVLN
jgi:malate synthase